VNHNPNVKGRHVLALISAIVFVCWLGIRMTGPSDLVEGTRTATATPAPSPSPAQLRAKARQLPGYAECMANNFHMRNAKPGDACAHQIADDACLFEVAPDVPEVSDYPACPEGGAR
jgi:hypothetical protein